MGLININNISITGDSIVFDAIDNNTEKRIVIQANHPWSIWLDGIVVVDSDDVPGAEEYNKMGDSEFEIQFNMIERRISSLLVVGMVYYDFTSGKETMRFHSGAVIKNDANDSMKSWEINRVIL